LPGVGWHCSQYSQKWSGSIVAQVAGGGVSQPIGEAVESNLATHRTQKNFRSTSPFGGFRLVRRTGSPFVVAFFMACLSASLSSRGCRPRVRLYSCGHARDLGADLVCALWVGGFFSAVGCWPGGLVLAVRAFSATNGRLPRYQHVILDAVCRVLRRLPVRRARALSTPSGSSVRIMEAPKRNSPVLPGD